MIEATAPALGAPLLAMASTGMSGRNAGGWSYQDETGLLDLPLPTLPGAHQIDNAGLALAALRHLGVGEALGAGRRRVTGLARPDATVAQRPLWSTWFRTASFGWTAVTTLRQVAQSRRHLASLPQRPDTSGLRDVKHQGRRRIHAPAG